MLKILLVSFVLITNIFANLVKEDKWPLGETFLTFLEKYQIPQKLYFDLEKEDRELCSEISADTYYYLIENDDKSLNQVLIPVSEEIQLHIYQGNDGNYQFETLPISYREFTETVSMPITSNVSEQLQDATGNAALAANLKAVFADVSFRKMQKGDYIVIEYTQKELLGRPFGQPDIKSAMVEVSGKKYYRFKNDKDDKYYDETGKAFTKFYFFKIPVAFTRISSEFTNKRWHPVLKRFRAHLGTDFAAPRGTKIYAAGDGVIEFIGVKGGYGNTTVIRHSNGFKTLYGHQNAFNKAMRRGKSVKKGDLIGYVGNTGLSSGPHLHLGLYKGTTAIDPMKVIRKPETVGLSGKEKESFIATTKGKIKYFNDIESNKNVLSATKFDRLESSSEVVLKEI